MKLQQGIRKLILIQAGSHRFSVIPMDNPISIFGRNNLGKSQSINSLQFLFFKHVKEMDFGSYDSSQSKQFYFKSEYSMIIAEIMVNEGVFLLGAAGRGPLHQYDYEHFLIKSPFNEQDFFEDGNHIKARDIFNKFEQRGLPVQMLTRDQLRQAITGNYLAAGIKHDITLMPIREATDSRISVYLQIFKYLLTMKKLTDRDIKFLVLEVFSNVLANTKIDFMRVKAEAFREYDGLKQEISSIKENEGEIRKLETDYNVMISSREAISDIKSRLKSIATQRMELIPGEIKNIADEKQAQVNILANSKGIFNQLLAAQRQSTSQLATVEQFLTALEAQKNYFDLPLQLHHYDEDLLCAKYQSTIDRLSSERSELNKNIDTSNKLSVNDIKNKIIFQESTIEDLETKINNAKNPDTWLDKCGYTAKQKKDLSRVLSSKFMGLSKNLMAGSSNEPNVFDNAFEIDGNQFIADSFTIDISSIRGEKFEEIDIDSLEMLLADNKEKLNQLTNELNVASDLEAALTRLSVLDSSIKKETNDLRKFEDFIESKKSEPVKLEEKSMLEAELTECEERLSAESERNTLIEKNIGLLNEQIEDLQNEARSLKTISQINFYLDPFIPFVEIDFDAGIRQSNDYINALIDEGNSNYGRFKGCQSSVDSCKERIFSRFTKHAAEQEDADIVRKLKEELDALPEKNTFLDKLHHEAVVKLASALNSLDKNYQRLEAQINDFNRKVNNKKVSNLKGFKLRLIPNQKALDAIKILMSSVESEGLDLFSSTVEKKTDLSISNEAISYLAQMVEQLGGNSLTLSELFELGFDITDANDNTVTHTSIDGHVSNGTTMTIKALFNMNLMRYFHDNRMSVHLPFYVDEATNIDDTNRRSLNLTSHDLGFTPIYASVDPVITAKYNINLEEAETASGLLIPEESWIRIQEKEDLPAEDQMELI